MAYETQFNRENIDKIALALKNAITEIGKTQEQKLDVFVILAALGTVSYDYSMAVLPRNDEERARVHAEMKNISDDLIKKLDALHIEKQYMGVSDVVAIAHVQALFAEYYARLRDDALTKMEAVADEPAVEEGK